MKIRIENVCCVAVDYQEKFMPGIAERDELLISSKKLLKGLGILEVPIFVTTQYAKGLGLTIPEIRMAAETEEYFDKKSFSIYGEEEIQKYLQALGKKQVILCGIEAHICILQSVIELIEAGYQPILVEDCISSRHLRDKKIAIMRARDEGAIVTTCESLLFELLKNADHEKFKQISSLVK